MTEKRDVTLELSYADRSMLLTALALARTHTRCDTDRTKHMDDLAARISRLECQEGGCPYCNAEAAREEEEWRAAYDYK